MFFSKLQLTVWETALGDQKQLRRIFSVRILNVTDVVVYGQVTSSQDGLPLVHMWRQMGDEVCMANFSSARFLNFSLTCVCALCVRRWSCWTDYWLNEGFAPGLRHSDVAAFRLSSLEPHSKSRISLFARLFVVWRFCWRPYFWNILFKWLILCYLMLFKSSLN